MSAIKVKKSFTAEAESVTLIKKFCTAKPSSLPVDALSDKNCCEHILKENIK